MNRVSLLYLNVLVIATCGLVYELLAGTLASYVLGDSVTQFSLCIGIYLTALGVGAWLSRFIDDGLARAFVEVELAVALLGGASAPILFLSFAYLDFFQLILFSIVFGVGTLVGLELPLLMRILRTQVEFKDLVSRVLTFDYIGALAGSLMFPIFLVPQLGLVRTSLVFGLLNAAVGFWGTWLLSPMLGGSVNFLRARALIVIVALCLGLVKADLFTTLSEDQMYADPVVYSKTSRYQRIIVARGGPGFQLYLNGNLQFNSIDEYRYHESLVHPVVGSVPAARSAIVLGGGDGLALRELLKYESLERILLVDLDPAMTNLSNEYPPLAELNEHAFDDDRVEVVNQDALMWLEQNSERFDVCVIDFPDPSNFSLGKLYTRRFYRLLRQHLTPEACVGIQCTSPLFARQTYWCIVATMESAGFQVRPYQVPIPSFGVWGFALARTEALPQPRLSEEVEMFYLTSETLASLFAIPADLARVPVDVNRLDNQCLVRYHTDEWRQWR